MFQHGNDQIEYIVEDITSQCDVLIDPASVQITVNSLNSSGSNPDIEITGEPCLYVFYTNPQGIKQFVLFRNPTVDTVYQIPVVLKNPLVYVYHDQGYLGSELRQYKKASQVRNLRITKLVFQMKDMNYILERLLE